MVGLAAATLGACALVAPAQALAASSPTLTGSLRNTTSLSGSTSVAISGSYAYATGYYSGQLVAVDISAPGSPTIAGASPSASSLFNGTNVTIANGYAYVVSKNRNASTTNNDNGTGNSLTILSLANPASPSIVGTLKDATNLFGAYGIAVSGNYAYIAAQGCLSGQPCPKTGVGDSFVVVDVSDPASPTILGTVKNSTLTGQWAGTNALKHVTSVALSGHYAYVTASYSDRLTVIDITDPHNPTIVASLHDPTNLNFDVDVAVSGNYAYVADQSSGLGRLAVVDISDPLNPTLAGTATNATYMNGAYRVKVRNNFAYVSGVYSASVGAVDVSNPTAPRFAGGYASSATLNRTTGLDVDPSGRYLFAVSPYASGESSTTYPPYPGTPGGPTATGGITGVNLDPAAISVTIAAGSKPANPTSSTSANFTFSTSDAVASVKCSLDSAALGSCTSFTTATYSGLASGSHTFTVQATDATGATATDSYTWVVSGGGGGGGGGGTPPTTPVLDNFNRANATTLGSNWSNIDTTRFKDFGITSNQARDAVTGYAWDYWNVQQFGPDSEAYATIAKAPTGTETVRVGVRNQPGKTNTGYAVQVAAGGAWTIQRLNGSSTSSIASGTSQTLAVGDEVLVRAVGSTIQGLWFSTASSTWTVMVTATDTTYAGAGFLSVEAHTAIIDDFGGGTIGGGGGGGVSAPTNSTAPTISGSATVGSQLTASTGTWNNSPTSFAYKWESCAGSTCTIVGSNASTYTIASSDLGNTIQVTVTASNTGGSGSATSTPTAAVTSGGGGGGGAGPTTPVLDTFNRANATTLGPNWSNIDPTRFKDFGITSNQCRDAVTGYAWDYWNAQQFGPDSEAYATIAAAPTGSEVVRIGVRNQPGTANTGYAVQVNAGGAWMIQRLNGTSTSQIASGTSHTLGVGDKVLARAVGSTIQGLYYSASSNTWTVMVTATDSTYSGAGYFSLEAHTAILDDFGGGSI